MLESLPLASDPAKDRTLILIKPNQDQAVFTIGRDEKNDIVISDRTISREQAILTLKADGFYLKDQYSKFGTSIQIREKTYVSDPESPSESASPICVQVGRTVMSFSTLVVNNVECL